LAKFFFKLSQTLNEKKRKIKNRKKMKKKKNKPCFKNFERKNFELNFSLSFFFCWKDKIKTKKTEEYL